MGLDMGNAFSGIRIFRCPIMPPALMGGEKGMAAAGPTGPGASWGLALIWPVGAAAGANHENAAPGAVHDSFEPCLNREPLRFEPPTVHRES